MEDHHEDQKLSPPPKWIVGVAGAILGLLVAAPITLSTVDLYDWATSPTGLGLPSELGWLPPVALDLAAVFCIAMTVLCTYRRQPPGVWSLLVWSFALASAWSQYQHGKAVKDAGGAQDLVWAMPMFAVIGPLLLEVGLHYGRKWLRQDSGELFRGAAGFGIRWLPGIAFNETRRAWLASRREGVSDAARAIEYVRTRDAIAGMKQVDALRFVLDAQRQKGMKRDLHAARVTLLSMGVAVTQQAVDEVDAQMVARDALTLTQPKVRQDRGDDARRPRQLAVVDGPPRRVKDVPLRVLDRPAVAEPGDADPVTQAVELVLTRGLSNRKAARQTGASEATVRRRLNEQRVNGHDPVAAAPTK